MKKIIRPFSIIVILVSALFWIPPTQVLDPETCPDTMYINANPSLADLDWTDDVQGVAHDDNHWFFTTLGMLLKIPVSYDLGTAIDTDDPPAGIQIVGIPPALKNLGYDHFGDLDHVGGFLFIPIEDSKENEINPTARPVIAVFRASDLGYIGSKVTDQIKAGWLAYNQHLGLLYSSNNNITSSNPPYRYRLDLDKLASANDVVGSITFLDRFFLLEANGEVLDPPLSDYIQGGVFTPWVDLYIVNGSESDDPEDVRGGIHLFGTDGRLIAESRNHSGAGAFNFEYHPGWDKYEEPEGIDWWNRYTGAISPGITGHLHVILLDNEWPNKDELFFKHYDVTYCGQDNDIDGDGLTDGDEGYLLGTDPFDADTDNDGIPDGMEVNTLGTNPLNKDSDNDGIPDGAEDTDSDGLTDGDEINTYGTNPLESDSDNDGLTDEQEINDYGTDPLSPDTDGDGLSDGEEVNTYRTDPLDPDSDHDGLTDGLEVLYGTDPANPDSDDDGLIDGQDVEFIQNAVLELPTSSFGSKDSGIRRTTLKLLDIAQARAKDEKVSISIQELKNLRNHFDGCGDQPDQNDWILNCSQQVTIRSPIDVLTDNLTGS